MPVKASNSFCSKYAQYWNFDCTPVMNAWGQLIIRAVADVHLTMSTTPFVVKHDGKKHNIEHFLRFHPGGTNTLSFLRNADVTERLIATHHSAAAYELLKDYRVDENNEHKYLREDGDLEVSVHKIYSSKKSFLKSS